MPDVWRSASSRVTIHPSCVRLPEPCWRGWTARPPIHCSRRSSHRAEPFCSSGHRLQRPRTRSRSWNHFSIRTHRARRLFRPRTNRGVASDTAARNVRRRRRAGPDRRIFSVAGRPWHGDPHVAWRAAGAGTTMAVDPAIEPAEAAEPIRYCGEVIGAIAMRWTAGVSVDATRTASIARVASLALAPNVRALIDRSLIPAAAPSSDDLLGESAAARALRESIANAARAPYPVLIQGESGSGKELVARAIHRLGPRRDRRFCALNCAALPDELVEAELFGHARGAFTGAVGERAGLFEEADGGTLFLDEVGELLARARRPSCCACSRTARSGASARTCRAASTCGSSRRPTAASRQEVGGRAVPRRPAVPARRRADRGAAAARARERHPAAGGALLARRGRARRPQATLAPETRRRAGALRLARQRARAAERARVAGRAVARRGPDWPVGAAGACGSGRRCRRPRRFEAAREEFERRFVGPRWRAPAANGHVPPGRWASPAGLAKMMRRLGLDQA